MPPLGFVAADVLDDGLSGFGALSQQSPLRRIDTVMPRLELLAAPLRCVLRHTIRVTMQPGAGVAPAERASSAASVNCCGIVLLIAQPTSFWA